MWACRLLHAGLSAAPRGRRAHSALTHLRGVLEEAQEAIRGAVTRKSVRGRASTWTVSPEVTPPSRLRVFGPGWVFEGPSEASAGMEGLTAVGGWEYLHT